MTTRALLAAVAITAVSISPVFAQQQPTSPKTKPAPATPAMPAKPQTVQPEKKPATPAMPEMDDAAKKMMEAMMPGPAHEMLNGMVGEWSADCKFWMAPGAPPTETKGTASNTWVLEKRFVKQDFKGTFSMGPGMPEMPFTGLGYTGYDNMKKKYVASWMDNMSTGIMYSEGSFDPGTKTFSFSASTIDPMSGKPATVTEVIKVVDENTHTFTMSGPGPDGKDMKMGEITYHRKGKAAGDSSQNMDKSTTPATPATPARPTTPAPKKPTSPS